MRLKDHLQFTVSIIMAASVAVAVAAEPPADLPLRLQVTLLDGSRLFGVPVIAAIPIQTDYATIDVPVRQLASLRIATDRKTVTVELQNGDKLSGTMTLKAVGLQTVFGAVSLDVQHVVSIHHGTTEFTHGNLVLYYSCDRFDGDTVSDKSASKIAGVNHGAEWIPDGVIGGAWRFSGKAGYVRIPQNANFAFLNRDFSAALWIRPDPDTFALPDAGAATLVDFESAGWRGWLLRFGTIYPSVSLGGAGSERAVLNTRPGVRQWAFIVVTYSHDKPELKGYLNGQLDLQQTIKLSLSGSPTDHGIGNNVEDQSQQYYGDIDEVMLFSSAITDEEIATLYRRGTGKTRENRL